MRKRKSIPKVISFVSEKGGAGKTTLACQMAAEYHRRGWRVLLVDADPQGTTQTWASVSADAAEESGVPLAAPDTIALGDALRKSLPGVAAAYDVTLIDCPGSLNKRISGALMVSDLALIPTRPSTTDFWAIPRTLDIVRMVQEVVPSLQVAIVVNQKLNTGLDAEVREALAKFDAPLLTASMGLRTALPEAMGQGAGVTTTARGSVAALELNNVADAVAGLIGLGLGYAKQA